MAAPQDIVGQIAFQLGLDPPGQYTPPPIAKHKGRKLGRTTSLILWALADVVQGQPVLFMAPTRYLAAELVHMAREYARQLGVDLQLIHLPLASGVEHNARWWPPGVKVYRDHSLNYGGGTPNEPQESCSSLQDGLTIGCPWCGRTIYDPLPAPVALCEGAWLVLDCPLCHCALRVCVRRVSIELRAWREDGLPLDP